MAQNIYNRDEAESENVMSVTLLEWVTGISGGKMCVMLCNIDCSISLELEEQFQHISWKLLTNRHLLSWSYLS